MFIRMAFNQTIYIYNVMPSFCNFNYFWAFTEILELPEVIFWFLLMPLLFRTAIISECLLEMFRIHGHDVIWRSIYSFVFSNYRVL